MKRVGDEVPRGDVLCPILCQEVFPDRAGLLQAIVDEEIRDGDVGVRADPAAHLGDAPPPTAVRLAPETCLEVLRESQIIIEGPDRAADTPAIPLVAKAPPGDLALSLRHRSSPSG